MKRRRLIILLVGLLVITPLAVTFGRYVVRNIRNYIMQANNFFFNSDKLVDGGITYEMNNWGGASNITIQFQLNNHKNNILTSDADITYHLSTTYDETKVSCSIDDVDGVIQKNEKTDDYTLIIVPQRIFNDNESVTVTVTAESSNPYEKTLSATFVITVGRRGIDYQITDKANQPYFIFTVTNASDKYKVVTPFGDYSANDPITTNEYMALSNEDKAKCASATITLGFDPSEVVLDTTSDIMKVATYDTTQYNNIDYIDEVTFNVEPLTSIEVRFYKRDSSENYTYPITNGTSVVSFSAS